jgi:hypothetical protein
LQFLLTRGAFQELPAEFVGLPSERCELLAELRFAAAGDVGQFRLATFHFRQHLATLSAQFAGDAAALTRCFLLTLYQRLTLMFQATLRSRKFQALRLKRRHLVVQTSAGRFALGLRLCELRRLIFQLSSALLCCLLALGEFLLATFK